MKINRLILIILTAFLPLAFWPGNTSHDALKFTILAAAGALLLGREALCYRVGKSRWLGGQQTIIFWVCLVLVLGLGLLKAENTSLVIRTGLLTSLFGIIALVTARQVGNQRGRMALMAALVGSAALAGMYGILQMTRVLPGADPITGFPAGISTLGNQNYLAGLMALALWPNLVLLIRSTTIAVRFLAGLSLAILLTTLVMAGAAGPQVAVLGAALMVVPCLVMVVRQKGPRVPLVLGTTAVLCLALGGGLLLDAVRSQGKANPAPHHRLLADNSGGIRLADDLAAVSMFKESPWIGVGAGNYLVQWPRHRAGLETTHPELDLPWGALVATRAHNDPLQWLAETGLVGLLFLVAALLWGAWAWRKRFSGLQAKDQIETLLLTAGLLTAMIHSLVSFPFHLPASGLAFAVTLGLVLQPRSAPPETENRPPDRLFFSLLILAAVALLVGSVREFSGNLLVASGRQDFVRGRLQSAVSRLETGTNRMTWPGQGPLFLGLARSALDQQELATGNFRQSLLERPSFEAYLALAESAINQQDFEGARQHLALLRGCRPQLSVWRKAEFLSGLLLLREGNLEEARAVFEGLLAEDPQQVRALLALGYLEILAGRDEPARVFYSRCIRVIDGEIEKFRQDPGVQSAAYLIQLQQNRLIAAKALESLP